MKIIYRVKISNVRETNLSADDLIDSLLEISKTETVCLLDSCGVSHLGSHLLLAGVGPVETLSIKDQTPEETLEILDRKLAENFAAVFTMSYEFGLRMERIEPRPKNFETLDEPDVFLALFDCLIVHDYETKQTFLTGDQGKFDELEKVLKNPVAGQDFAPNGNSKISSNFTRAEYLEAIEQIRERIRRGDTYQTNLTHQITARLPEHISPQTIFRKLRKNHPAPFAAFLKRPDDYVVSASPERFFKVENDKRKSEKEDFSGSSAQSQPASRISVSPIKGTRPRGKDRAEDESLKKELLNSAKDRAENIMIVDLLRNDIGRVCEFGSVEVEKLCDLEEHPTLFHLVSTVSGNLRPETKFSDIIRAIFPCGSITGAPKISTMRIIDRLETAPRGLSMGAIGCAIQHEDPPAQNSENIIRFPFSVFRSLDLSVAIRTMVIKNERAVFNVGAGIVIDSVPEKEYEETLVKAKVLLDSINADFDLPGEISKGI